MTRVQLTLPDQLGQQAQRARPLSPARLENWLRDRLKDHGVYEPAAMSPEDVAQETASMRAEQRAKNAS